MKNIQKILIAATFLASPILATAQIGGGINPGGFGSTTGAFNDNEFQVDTFFRVRADYRNAINHGGVWSNRDVVFVVGTRISARDNTFELQEMLRQWRNISNQELLAQLQQDLENFSGPEDCSQTLGLVDFFRDVLSEIALRENGIENGQPRHEWGSALVLDNGNVTIRNDAIYSDSDRTEVSHFLSSAELPNLVSILHNHPRQGASGANINLENRYPSDDDWSEADRIVGLGANPNLLSLTIVDPFGDARVFPYSQNAAYRNLSPNQQRSGQNLPDEVPHTADIENAECVNL